MGLLLRITKISYWVDAVIILMIEACFEIMICSLVGIKSISDKSIVTSYDYTSAAFNIFFLVILTLFITYIVIIIVRIEISIRSDK